LETITQDDCDDFIKAMVTPRSTGASITAIRALHAYGELVTYDTFAEGFRPWGTRTASSTARAVRPTPLENKTPPIPDRVFAPLVAASLHLVETIAPDADAALAHLAPLEAVKSTRGGTAPDFDARLDAYLQSLRSEGRSIPTTDGDGRRNHIDMSMIALHLGMQEPRHLRRDDRRSKILAAANDLGTGPGGLYGVRPGSEFSRESLSRTIRAILFACYIIVASLSGMRTSELAEIRRGWGVSARGARIGSSEVPRDCQAH
jgi:hypothetical protein